MSAIGALLAVRVGAAAGRDRPRRGGDDRRAAGGAAGVRRARPSPAAARRTARERRQHQRRAGRIEPHRRARVGPAAGRLLAALRRPGARRGARGAALLLRARARRSQRRHRQPARVRRSARGDLGGQLPRSGARGRVRHAAPRPGRSGLDLGATHVPASVTQPQRPAAGIPDDRRRAPRAATWSCSTRPRRSSPSCARSLIRSASTAFRPPTIRRTTSRWG